MKTGIMTVLFTLYSQEIGEGATIKLAKDHGDMLKSYEAKMEKKFNMAEGI